MTSVGLRKRVYKDRELDQLARDTDAGLRALLRMLGPFDLKSDTEKELPFFRWGGRPIYYRSWSGLMPGIATPVLLDGIDEPLLTLGWATVSGDRTPNLHTTTTSLNVVVSDGALRIVNDGADFDTEPYSLTVFYTRRGN